MLEEIIAERGRQNDFPSLIFRSLRHDPDEGHQPSTGFSLPGYHACRDNGEFRDDRRTIGGQAITQGLVERPIGQSASGQGRGDEPTETSAIDDHGGTCLRCPLNLPHVDVWELRTRRWFCLSLPSSLRQRLERSHSPHRQISQFHNFPSSQKKNVEQQKSAAQSRQPSRIPPVSYTFISLSGNATGKKKR